MESPAASDPLFEYGVLMSTVSSDQFRYWKLTIVYIAMFQKLFRARQLIGMSLAGA